MNRREALFRKIHPFVIGLYTVWTLWLAVYNIIQGLPYFYLLSFGGLLFLGVFPALYRLLRLYGSSIRRVTFMFNAVDNDDLTFRFNDDPSKVDSAMLNAALNRIKEILLRAKMRAEERERYYQLIMECAQTGLITINDTVVAGVKMRQDEVMKRLRGPRGSKVKLGIQRVGVKDLVPITVTRGVIPIYCINAAYMIGPETGYIVFAQFSRNAHKELMDAVDRLKAQGMKKLILDIRSNPGGFLDQAIEIANEFLPARKMIVYTVERGGEQSRQYSNGKGRLQDIELAVLVDEGSASSSEILAGALQDNDRGTIIGRRTFGKGLVQEQIPFPDGSAVRLTIARYYTPSGRSIQKPYDKGSEDYNNDLMNRYEHNEMFSADSIHFADSLKYFTAGGRTVYGGGGIMPDRFVPADTTDITPYLREVTGRNILYRFTIEYADRHRNELNRITTLPELDAFFAKDPGLLSEFIRYAARAGVAPKPSQIERSKAIILSQIKAYVGRNTPLEDNAFYHALQGIDSTVQQALKEMSAPKAEQALNTAEHE